MASSNPAESTLVVHHLNNSRSQRILWLLEELQVPYTIKRYQRTKSQKAPPELFEVHPLGKSPVLTDVDEEGKPITVAESGAIVEYIISKYDKSGKVSASTPASIRTNTYYMHFTEGSLMSSSVFDYVLLLSAMQVSKFMRPLVRKVTQGIAAVATKPHLQNCAKMIEGHLASVPANANFAGEPDKFTGADFLMIFPLETMMVRYPGWFTDKPAIKAWVSKVQSLPTYKVAVEKGGEYAYIPKSKM